VVTKCRKSELTTVIKNVCNVLIQSKLAMYQSLLTKLVTQYKLLVKQYLPVYTKLGDVNKITMEFLEKNRFKGIIFLGNGKVHNGYIDKVQKYDDYLKWAVKNIY